MKRELDLIQGNAYRTKSDYKVFYIGFDAGKKLECFSCKKDNGVWNVLHLSKKEIHSAWKEPEFGSIHFIVRSKPDTGAIKIETYTSKADADNAIGFADVQGKVLHREEIKWGK